MVVGGGGGGRANGLGGPWAPALNSALAEGEGGGRTRLPFSPAALGRGGPVAAVVVLTAAVAPCGEEPAVVLPLSEFSLGI